MSSFVSTEHFSSLLCSAIVISGFSKPFISRPEQLRSMGSVLKPCRILDLRFHIAVELFHRGLSLRPVQFLLRILAKIFKPDNLCATNPDRLCARYIRENYP
jgi:hypothetical protein